LLRNPKRRREGLKERKIDPLMRKNGKVLRMGKRVLLDRF